MAMEMATRVQYQQEGLWHAVEGSLAQSPETMQNTSDEHLACEGTLGSGAPRQGSEIQKRRPETFVVQ
jgi:hypothetical protein